MYQLKGFMVIPALINNNLGEDSVLGELSANARSFSKELGYFSDPTISEVRLVTFSSYDEHGFVKPDINYTRAILKLGKWLCKESLANRITQDKQDFVQKLTAEYLGVLKVTEVGKMATDGKYWLPEYISFHLIADSRENQYTIWFENKAFEGQYDDFDIEVITPILTVDDFFKEEQEVKKLLTENTVEKLHLRVNEKKAAHPYTLILSFNYDWVNPHDKSDTVPTAWTVIIYGNAGNDYDKIRDKIADYILAHSDYGRDQWEKILPDLFVPTEFYLSPRWTHFSTENLQLKGGIYSPQVPYRDVVPWCIRTMHGFKEDHISQYAVIFDSIYKSIAVIACGHPKNRLAPIEFEKAWPDYANIRTLSLDFNRISPRTQKFIMMMNEMFLEAETMTPDSRIPDNMTRIKRGDIYYLSKLFEGVTYLVPLRYNFLYEISQGNVSSHITPPVIDNGDSDADEKIKSTIEITPSIRSKDIPDTHRGMPATSLTDTIETQ